VYAGETAKVVLFVQVRGRLRDYGREHFHPSPETQIHRLNVLRAARLDEPQVLFLLKSRHLVYYMSRQRQAYEHQPMSVSTATRINRRHTYPRPSRIPWALVRLVLRTDTATGITILARRPTSRPLLPCRCDYAAVKRACQSSGW
jgi:hypothetical protein